LLHISLEVILYGRLLEQQFYQVFFFKYLTQTVQVFDIVGEEKKEFYLSFVAILGFIGHIIATPAFGALSDKTNFKYGKRRIYIAIFVPISCFFFMFLPFFTSPNMFNIVAVMLLLLVCQVTTSGALGNIFTYN
jgi:MFS family permease